MYAHLKQGIISLLRSLRLIIAIIILFSFITPYLLMCMWAQHKTTTREKGKKFYAHAQFNFV